MVTLINPPSRLHYLRAMRSPALLGCDACKYGLRNRRALSGVGRMSSLRGTGLGDAGVPAGTILGYSATWSQGSFASPADIIAQIKSVLSGKWGVIVDQSSYTDPLISLGPIVKTITLQVHTNSDYGTAQDIQSIINGEIYNILGAMPQSTIRIIQQVAPNTNVTAQLPGSVSAALSTAQAGYQDAVARGDSVSADAFAQQIAAAGGQDPRGTKGWFSDNWLYLAGAGLGFILIKEIF